MVTLLTSEMKTQREQPSAPTFGNSKKKGKSMKFYGGQCALCTVEKFHIIYKPELASLNLRNELGAHCTHKQSVLLDKT